METSNLLTINYLTIEKSFKSLNLNLNKCVAVTVVDLAMWVSFEGRAESSLLLCNLLMVSLFFAITFIANIFSLQVVVTVTWLCLWHGARWKSQSSNYGYNQACSCSNKIAMLQSDAELKMFICGELRRAPISPRLGSDVWQHWSRPPGVSSTCGFLVHLASFEVHFVRHLLHMHIKLIEHVWRSSKRIMKYPRLLK